MTVQKVIASASGSHGRIEYDCVWFEGKQLKTGRFAEEALTAYTPDKDLIDTLKRVIDKNKDR